MGFQVTFVGDDGQETTVDLDDLSPDAYEQIARTDIDGGNYWHVYKWPAQNLARTFAVLDAAADHAGVPHIDRPTRAGDLQAIQDLFVRKVDIADEPMEGGFPPEPGATESGSSSGAPGDSDGTGSSAEGSP